MTHHSTIFSLLPVLSTFHKIAQTRIACLCFSDVPLIITRDEDRVKVSVEFRFHRSHKLQCFFLKFPVPAGSLERMVGFHWLSRKSSDFIGFSSSWNHVPDSCKDRARSRWKKLLSEKLTWAKLC